MMKEDYLCIMAAGYCRVIEIDTSDMRTVLMNKSTGRYESDSLIPSKQAVKKDPALANKDNTYMANGPSIRKIDGNLLSVLLCDWT